MIVVVECFVVDYLEYKGVIVFFIISDEEGLVYYGIKVVVECFVVCGECLDWCIVGELLSISLVGDVVKNGCCGFFGVKLIICGVQGYVVYLYLVKNLIYLVVLVLVELVVEYWDDGNVFFLLISFQVFNLNFGIGVINVIFGELIVLFNFCFFIEFIVEGFQKCVEVIFDKYGLDWYVEWVLFGLLFFIELGELFDVVVVSIRVVIGCEIQFLISGGIFDGCFIVIMGIQVVEFGLVNVIIYQVNEWVLVSDLELFIEIYYQILVRLFV